MFQGVGSPEANFYIRNLKQSCYISSFFACACKGSPSLTSVFSRIFFLSVFIFSLNHPSYNYYSLMFRLFSSNLLSSVIGNVYE
jgi:hypothetical protein